MQLLIATIEMLCSPVTQFFVLILISVLLKLNHRLGLSHIVMVTAFCWLLLCSQYFFSNKLLNPIEHDTAAIPYDSPQLNEATQVVFLGGYINDDEDSPLHTRFSAMTVPRIDAAFKLHQRYNIPVLFTGGYFTYQKSTPYTDFIEQYLLQLGMVEASLLPIPQGTNTSEEIEALIPYLKDNITVVISTATHLPRIKRELTQHQLEASYIWFPIDHVSRKNNAISLNMPSTHALEACRRAFYEYAALLWYKYK